MPAPVVRPVPTSGYRFQIVTGDDSSVTARIAEDLYKRLVPTFAGFRTELAQRRRMVYVAIGPIALREVAGRRCDCVVIAAFTSSQVWQSVVDKLPPARAKAMTAVYAEPAPADQLRLAALLYRRPVRAAAILGPETGFLLPHLVPHLLGQAEIVHAPSGADMSDVLARIGRSEVLLALPDSAVYNPENIRNILLSTYRRKQGVIGFSSDMVKVGALATTYSEVEDINAQVAEMAARFVATGELPPPQFPRYFRTAINEGVARSLDIAVSDEARRFARPRP
ncbi:hypothetical protein [Massilia niabensis]|uniref:ABC transporter substrate-binding protein n=1 Tax=Massilia niabensis TaxID=544910 RepID=A0ABW0L2R7_9BURK